MVGASSDKYPPVDQSPDPGGISWGTEGQHVLWTGVSDPYKHTIRAFLVHFHSAILQHSTERFSFLNGSVGALCSHWPALVCRMICRDLLLQHDEGLRLKFNPYSMQIIPFQNINVLPLALHASTIAEPYCPHTQQPLQQFLQ